MPTSLSLHYRLLEVPEAGAGLRLDRFLARRFGARSRSELVRGIKAGQVTDASGKPLRASLTLKGGETLHLYLPGIAPSTAPPPMPPILWEDDRVAVVHKPAGLLAHPAGTDFAWSLIRCAKDHWPEHRIDLAHRLDRDTSGVLVLSKDAEANLFLKEAFVAGQAQKHYLALCRGQIPWRARELRGPLGLAGGPIRIQMAVRDDGLEAHTDVEVLSRGVSDTLVRCRLHTGRTHQIRVHLAHAGYPLVGDLMYGLPPEQALHGMNHGWTEQDRADAGAPRQALHSCALRVPHPDGGVLSVSASMPADMREMVALAPTAKATLY